MAFSKFDPHREEPEEKSWDTAAKRRALLLKYGWWLTLAYTAMGFVLIGYWILQGRA